MEMETQAKVTRVMSTFILSYQVVEPIWSDSTAAYCLGDVLSFLEKDDLAPAILVSCSKSSMIQEVKDGAGDHCWQSHLSKATYILEGDGALAQLL